MCGRYASSASTDDLVNQFDVDDVFPDLPGPDYNVAPTVAVPAVLERADKQTDHVRRRLAPLVWGLVPSWAKDPSIGSRMINARLETVAEKPAFRKAFSTRRCLLPADGFYEWYTPDAAAQALGRPARAHRPIKENRAVKTKKQPFFIHRADGGLLVMAGIYEIWRDPTKSRDDPTAWLRTCAVITTEATDAVGHIHDRMPMVIGKDAYDAWLDPTLTDPDEALRLLEVTDAGALEVYAVSTDVNSVKNNDPSLVRPLETADEAVSGEESADDSEPTLL
ncbi:MAG TPA: SOS response-associated peptidase [Propionibacteriaceae bacterium]|nr:SOS response-associated peptidase [Propionibacteriaceae bacterium]